MENTRFYIGNLSHLGISAALSITAVVGVAWWQIDKVIRQQNTDLNAVAAVTAAADNPDAANALRASLGTYATSSTSEEISQIGSNTIGRLVTDYALLTQNATYTPELGAQIVAHAMSSMQARVPYALYDEKSTPTDSDTSYKRALTYRSALQISLAPLKKNKKYELDLYNAYMKTHDASYLTQLKTASRNYADAASNTATVTVPVDAVSVQVGILNAMQEFAATLNFMVDNINDPVTSVALLKSYNQAEADMYSSFDALNAYYATKRP